MPSIKEAEARLRAAKAAAAATEARIAARDKEHAKAVTLRARLARKVGPLVYLETAKGDPKETTGIGLYGIAGWQLPKDRKGILAAIEAGTKLTMPGMGSVTVAAKTAVDRTRIPSTIGLRAMRQTKAAYERAYAKERKAAGEYLQAVRDAFATGTKPTQDQLVDALVTDYLLRKAAALTGEQYAGSDGYTRERDQREIAQATTHLLALRAKEVCTCADCERERHAAAELAARRERIAALPRVKARCPDHGPRLMGFERAEGWFDGRRIVDLPRVWCPVDLRAFVHEATFAKDEAKRAKARKEATAA